MWKILKYKIQEIDQHMGDKAKKCLKGNLQIYILVMLMLEKRAKKSVI